MRKRLRYPQAPKISPDDKGALKVVMANKGDQVVIEFDARLRWFSMDIRTAEEFIANLQGHVLQLKEGAKDGQKI